MNKYYLRKTCRICDSSDLVKILDLGVSPMANAYLDLKQLSQPEEKFPLSTYYCKNCTLVQVLDVVNPSLLFHDYHFITSASTPSVKHFKEYADMVSERFIISPDNLCVDIGGNDAVLSSFLQNNAEVINIDPASNLKSFSEEKGVSMICDFFTSKLAKMIRKKYGEATVVTANNVTAHIDDIKDVYKGIATLIGENGVFIAESHWVKDLINNVSFDQIYHEHLCFYSLHALSLLANLVGLTIFDVEMVPMQGQSLRIFVSKNRKVLPSVKAILEQEKKAGLTNVKTYLDFSSKVEKSKISLKKLLTDLKKTGKKIVGYGAPAKGNTLLNYYNVDTSVIDYLTDSTPAKQGLYSPGMHIPIYSPDRLKIEKPDYILLLAWNYTDVILEKEKDLRKQGVKFIVTVPELRVI